MPVRIAIAVEADGQTPAHFGRAEGFRVVDVSIDGRDVIETRAVPPACAGGGVHDEDRLVAAVDLLGDCRYVFVVNIGPYAERLLNRRGVDALPIGKTIEATLDRLAKSPFCRERRYTPADR